MLVSKTESFDIIVVGGGTAGCVIASRLSENTSLRILLLEAGSDNNNDPKVLTPLRSFEMLGDATYDWNYRTSPQQCANGRIFNQTRGRMLGGSSAINSNSLVYPNEAMFDTWAEIVGDEIWSWREMKPLLRKFQTVQPDPDGAQPGQLDDVQTVSKGPIQASYPRKRNRLHLAWEETFKSLDCFHPGDGADSSVIGGVTTTNAIDARGEKGERSHAGDSYISMVRGCENLTIKTETQIEKLALEALSDSTEIQVTGVYYYSDGQRVFAKAEREVVLCAGVFGSPQLLELSGIGDEEILRRAGVPCLVNLPNVGENLQDHYNFGPCVEVKSDIETLDEMYRHPAVAQREYENHRTGPLAEGAAYSYAYWPLQLLSTSKEEAALRRSLQHLDRLTELSALTRLQFSFNRKMLLQPDEASSTVTMVQRGRYFTHDDERLGNYISVIAMLSHPFSRGSSHITGPTVAQQPRIDPNYLSHPLDTEVLAWHTVQIDRLLSHSTLSKHLKPQGRKLPAEIASADYSAEDLAYAIREYGRTNYHPCGTCAMASADLGGVVDGSLRVRGTRNLRVCDASVFPIIPRGNILSTVYAVAERGAELISRDYVDTSFEDHKSDS